MPDRTKSVNHYHMTRGCHGAYTDCGTEGLLPCSVCCGGKGRRSDGGSDVIGDIGGGSTVGTVATGMTDSVGATPSLPIREGDPTGMRGKVVQDGTNRQARRRNDGRNDRRNDGRSGKPTDGRPSQRRRPVATERTAQDGKTSQTRPRGPRRIPNAAGCSYTGYFLPPDQMASLTEGLRERGIPSGTLARRVGAPHVTLSYMPDDAHEGLFGRTQRILVTGYANDGRNEGVSVEFVGELTDADLAGMTGKVAVPHITLSVSSDGKPVDTGSLDFKPLDKPFELTGTYGGYRPSERQAVTTPPKTAATSIRRDEKLPLPKEPDGTMGLTDDDMFRVMDNPAIPRTGIRENIRPIIASIRASRGMLAVMRGSAGCGKSTIIKGLGIEDSVVSPDEIRLAISGLETSPDGKVGISQKDNRLVWQIARQSVEKRCTKGDGTILVDAMHTRARDIQQWQQVADRHGYELVVVDLTDVPRDVSHQRNASRVEWKQVPDFVIDRFYDAAERNTQAIRREFVTVDRRGFKDIIDGLRGDR